MTRVGYLSHPIGPDDDVVARADHMWSASRWLGFLIEHTRMAVMAGWLGYLNAPNASGLTHPDRSANGGIHGPRALADQITLLERSDLVIQVGGWRSPHMEIEERHAVRQGIPVVSLLQFGADPPREEDRIAAVLRELRWQIDQTYHRPHQRVWLAFLRTEDVETLRAAQERMRANPADAEARRVVSWIVSVASQREQSSGDV